MVLLSYNTLARKLGLKPQIPHKEDIGKPSLSLHGIAICLSNVMPKNKGTKHVEKEMDKSPCLAVTLILSKVKSVVHALNAVWNHVVFMFEDEMLDWFP